MQKKQVIAMGLAGVVTIGSVFGNSTLSVFADDTQEKILGKASYLWNFENEVDQGAVLKGTAELTKDEERDSVVLDLKGGDNGSSYMSLPQELFKDVKDGFTISMWVKPDNSANAYAKIFDASNSELGATYAGTNWWKDPDLAFAVGGENYDTNIYVGEAGTEADTSAQLKYSTSLTKGKWQYYTVSISKDSYTAYLDGQKIEYSTLNNKDLSSALKALFGDKYISTLEYAAIGRGFYTSDGDFQGKIDDFAFFSEALSDKQIEALYKEETTDTTEPDGKDEGVTLVYGWDFENVTDKDAGNGATLKGSAEIVSDRSKGSNVLSLSGGDNGSSYMELPSDLFSKLGNDGFTITMWVKASKSTGSYTKIFDASNSELGATYNGNNGWSSPDFALAAGGEVYDATFYIGEPNKSASVNTKLKYSTHLERDAWQQMTISISPTDYSVYINGEKVSYEDKQGGTGSVSDMLTALFADDYLASLKYAALGRSVYTSDADFTGYLDDVNFYKGAMTADEAKALFESYPDIDTSVPAGELSINMTETTGEVKHGASGFLYGLGADNVPNVNLLTGLKPNIAEQNAPNGLQHPSGDTLEIAGTFLDAGGKAIQIACLDIHANWPYEDEAHDMTKYSEKIKTMVQKVKDAGLSDSIVYVPFNEPEGQGYWGETTSSNPGQDGQFLKDWKTIYDAIKSVDENAMIAGPNYAEYRGPHLKAFVQFCAENDCIPDQITWHVLYDQVLENFSDNLAEYRSWEKEYWLDTGLITEEREIVVNEYATAQQLGVPGSLTSYIGVFEDQKVNACLAYWHVSNNLCDIAADNNEPNGAWWLYKWYGDMSGQTVKINTIDTTVSGLYGVASIDDNKKSANIIFGGAVDGSKITLTNISQTEAFKDAKKVNVKLEKTSWSGINGAADGTDLVYEKVCSLDENGNLTIEMSNAEKESAYNITITQAADNAEETVTEGAWKKLYEAENARLSGSASVVSGGWYACSGTGQVQSINSASDSVNFDIEVPEDGYYKFDLIYGAATGNNTADPDKNDPKNAVQTVSVDGGDKVSMTLANTASWFMSGLHTEYLYLKKGSHTVTVAGTSSEGKGSVDCMYLTYVGDDEESVETRKNVKTYEAELGDFNVLGSQTSTSAKTQNSISGYSASGYVTGLDTSVKDGGGVRFNVCVNENGVYNIKVRYASNSAGTIGYYVNNTNLELDNKVTDVVIEATNGEWKEVSADIYLQKGMNILDFDASSADVALDMVTVALSDDGTNTVVIEAEDCTLEGDAKVKENSYASGEKYVGQMKGSSTGENALTFTYDADVAGTYEVAVYQSNKELFGGHVYNPQMVDRYITISVNDGDPFKVYFRNTYSDESFKSQVISLDFKKGTNTVRIWNDDERVLKNGVGGVNTCTNYTPNLDKFEITPLLISGKSAVEDPDDTKKDDTTTDDTKKDDTTTDDTKKDDTTTDDTKSDDTKKDNTTVDDTKKDNTTVDDTKKDGTITDNTKKAGSTSTLTKAATKTGDTNTTSTWLTILILGIGLVGAEKASKRLKRKI